MGRIRKCRVTFVLHTRPPLALGLHHFINPTPVVCQQTVLKVKIPPSVHPTNALLSPPSKRPAAAQFARNIRKEPASNCDLARSMGSDTPKSAKHCFQLLEYINNEPHLRVDTSIAESGVRSAVGARPWEFVAPWTFSAAVHRELGPVQSLCGGVGARARRRVVRTHISR